MDPQFWLTRWQDNKIGFHQSETNTLLLKYWPNLTGRVSDSREVFVPLCGKSLDMTWLAQAPQNHHVIGIELSQLAIEQYFETERGAVPAPEHRSDHAVYRDGNLELWCGDVFKLPEKRFANTQLVYDRAALIALPPAMRKAYADKLMKMLPADACILLLTISYDQSQMEGPPFSVTDEEVHGLFGEHRSVEHMESRDGLEGATNLKDRGLTALTSTVHIIGKAHQA